VVTDFNGDTDHNKHFHADSFAERKQHFYGNADCNLYKYGKSYAVCDKDAYRHKNDNAYHDRYFYAYGLADHNAFSYGNAYAGAFAG
jgi:hypothetical protein